MSEINMKYGASNVEGVSAKDGNPGYLGGFIMSNPINVELMEYFLNTGDFNRVDDPEKGIILVQKKIKPWVTIA